MRDDKEALREQLEADIAAFLSKGGEIDRVEMRRHAPLDQSWIARRGMDYSSSHTGKSVAWPDEWLDENLPY